MVARSTTSRTTKPTTSSVTGVGVSSGSAVDRLTVDATNYKADSTAITADVTLEPEV